MTDDQKLGIEVEIAELLYREAGELVDEDKPQISLLNYEHLLRDEVDLIIKQVLAETRLIMKLQDIQLLMKNVVLVNLTGFGKILCAYLSPLVLRKVVIKEKGVGVGMMQLNAVMDKKLRVNLSRPD